MSVVGLWVVPASKKYPNILNEEIQFLNKRSHLLDQTNLVRFIWFCISPQRLFNSIEPHIKQKEWQETHGLTSTRYDSGKTASLHLLLLNKSPTGQASASVKGHPSDPWSFSSSAFRNLLRRRYKGHINDQSNWYNSKALNFRHKAFWTLICPVR